MGSILSMLMYFACHAWNSCLPAISCEFDRWNRPQSYVTAFLFESPDLEMRLANEDMKLYY